MMKSHHDLSHKPDFPDNPKDSSSAPEALPLKVQLSRALREAIGLGMRDCHHIMVDAEQNLDGDYILAAFARHAHGLAINVKSSTAGQTDAEARREWDLRWARKARSSIGPEWAEVERLSALIASEQA